MTCEEQLLKKVKKHSSWCWYRHFNAFNRLQEIEAFWWCESREHHTPWRTHWGNPSLPLDQCYYLYHKLKLTTYLSLEKHFLLLSFYLKVLYPYLAFLFVIAAPWLGVVEISGYRKLVAPSGMDFSIPGGNYKLSRGWVETNRIFFNPGISFVKVRVSCKGRAAWVEFMDYAPPCKKHMYGVALFPSTTWYEP